MLSLYRDKSCKRDMQRPGCLSEENKKLQFLKLAVFSFKFSDENNIAKLVVDMWGNCSYRLCQSTFPELNTFQIFLFRLYFRKSVNSLLNYAQNKLSKF